MSDIALWIISFACLLLWSLSSMREHTDQLVSRTWQQRGEHIVGSQKVSVKWTEMDVNVVQLYLCIYMYTAAPLRVHIWICLCVCTLMSVSLCVYLSMFLYVCVSQCVSLCSSECLCVSAPACRCLCVCAHECVSVCLCPWVHLIVYVRTFVCSCSQAKAPFSISLPCNYFLTSVM